MRRKGTAIAIISVLMLVVGVMMGAVGAVAQSKSLDKNVQPSDGTLIINYPAFPNSGGPYIVGATYDPDNDRVVLVFNEDIDAATTSATLSDDFEASFAFDSGAALGDDDGDNVLYITGLDPADGGDQFLDNGAERIRLKLPGVLASTPDGSLSDEVTWVQVGRGPIPVRVELVDPAAVDSLQTVRIYWDAPVAKIGTAVNTFGATSELAGTLFGYFGTGSATWTLRDSTTTVYRDNFGAMLSGVSKLRVAAGQVRYVGASAVVSDRERVQVFDNFERGPVLIASYYDTKGTVAFDDDIIWALFNEPIAGSNFLGLGDVNFAVIDNGGGFDGVGGGSTLSFPGSTTATIRISGFTGTTTLPDGDDALRHNGTLADFQGQVWDTANDALIHNGPGIIRASYNDGQTASLINDRLVIWLSEPIANPAEVDTSDFVHAQDDPNGAGTWFFGDAIQVLVEANVSGLGKVTFSNFSGAPVGKAYRPGLRIRATDITPIQGNAGRVVNDFASVPIVDESRPIVELDEVALTDRWDVVNELDTLEVVWRENNASIDDGDQYFLFLTRKSPLDITNDWMDNNLVRAIPNWNPRPGITGDTIRVRLIIDYQGTGGAETIKETTDLEDIGLDDQLRVLVASADFTGNTMYRTGTYPPPGYALLFGSAMWVGPICPPQDFYLTPGDNARWDSDIIHVTGDSTATGLTYSVFGDTLAIPCSADSVVAYYDPDDPDNLDGNEVRIGAGPVKNRLSSDSSFDPFPLTFPLDWDRTEGFIYLAAKLGVDETPAASRTQIALDAFYPGVVANQIYDPWNPYRVYNANDYVNIRLQLNDRIRGTAGAGSNDVANVVADFSLIDSLTTVPTGFTTPPDSIVLWGLGRDRLDNDGDWYAQLVTGADNDPVDVGLDGLPGTSDVGEDNGVPDPGDPFVDENGNGSYDPGETFVDLVNQAGQTGVYDAGEPFLDSLDPDERGWYEVRTNVAGDIGNVQQGYKLDPARVRKLAYTDPLSLVRFSLLDNGVDGTVFPGQFQRPGVRRSLSLDHTTILDGTDPQQRFLATIDFQEPTVVEFTSIKNGVTELLAPGNPVYNLGGNVDFTLSTPSDNDVLFVQMQFKAEGDATWKVLTLDPVGDANNDGFPGAEEFDDDGDGLADLDDLQVDAADDTTLCKADRVDNDNDAYFVFDSFGPGDPVDPTNPLTFGRIVWWQIDESKTNGLDDDDDNSLWDADEVNEAVGYDPRYDDDEDGIMDGERVAVVIDGVHSVFGPDPAWTGTVYVSASVLYGARTTSSVAANTILQKYYGNGVAYTELIERGFPVLTARDGGGGNADEQRFMTDAASTGWDTDRPEASRFDGVTSGTSFGVNWGYGNEFNWADSKGGTLDLDVIRRIYNLTADGQAKYMLRGVAYDLAGNANQNWSEPITFTMDLTPPVANIDGCGTDVLNAGSDFLPDVYPGGTAHEIYDAGKHPETYTLTLQTVDADAAEVLFQERRKNADGTWSPWTEISTDTNAPFQVEWPNDGVMFTVNNYPASRFQDVEFRALATDTQGNVTAEDDACVFDVRVIDGTEPGSWIRGVYLSTGPDYYEADEYTPLGVTVQVPADSSVNVWVRIEDRDRDAKGRLTTLLAGKSVSVGDLYTTMWAAGIDGKTGNANIDDDGNGTPAIDEDDPGGLGGAPDGIYTLGAGPLGDDLPDDRGAGPDSIPGTADDEWGRGVNNDDYITNDVKYVVFQYRVVNPPGEWTDFATVHGDDGAGAGVVYDYTSPIKATLNTQELADLYGEGTYELRAYACDVEGNCNIDTAPIATIAIRSVPLRAYIQPEVCTDNADQSYDLYAVHFLHDYEIDKVKFYYYRDTDGDECANDLGSTWVLIGIDEAAGQGDSRGDAVLYMPGQFEPVANPDALDLLTYEAQLNTMNYRYWDADGDGYYSPRDPVVFSANATWESANDTVVIGSLPDGFGDGSALEAFADDIYYAQLDAEAAGLDPSDWIFRENRLQADNNALDRWTYTWDMTGLPEGNYLVKSIAVDAQNNEDVITYTCYEPDVQNPEEIELVRLDSTPPLAQLEAMILPDGTSLDLVTPDSTYFIPGVTDWVKITATGPAETRRMKFEYSLDGGMNWVVIDPNDDDDFYADIDGNAGFSGRSGNAAVLDDEIFNDLNGNFIFDGSDIDFVRSEGDYPGIQTPLGWPLHPLVGEDAPNGINDDGDYLGENVEGEDAPGGLYDETAPFYAYLLLDELGLLTDVNLMVRATAYDEVCDGFRAGPADVDLVIAGENLPPEADVIRSEDLDGVLVDVNPPVHDGTPVAVIGASMDTLRVFVTAEDMSTIAKVELFYRLDPSCHTGSPEEIVELQAWKSMTVAGWTVDDLVYPYDFNVATDAIPDGVYQFYPRAYDQSGNYNEAPVNPWGFKKFGLAGDPFAFVSTPAGPPALPDTAAVADEYVIHASLIDPSQAPTTAVRFYYAHRILDEVIDPATIQPFAPFESPNLDNAPLGGATGDGVLVTIDGDVATYWPSLAMVAVPTKLDYTVSGSRIVFGARPESDDVILVSYNTGSWIQIGVGDTWSPYTVAWSQEDGGVPEPTIAGTDAYDLIAVALFDVNGDGEYNTDCDYTEPLSSEGNYLYLDDQDRPNLILYGLTYDSPTGPPPYPDWNWPGNPLFRGGDELNGPNYEHILSGIESDIFVVATDPDGIGGEIEMVTLDITATDVEGGGTTDTHIEMTPYLTGSTIMLPITFYEDDYPMWTPGSIENVILEVDRDGIWGNGDEAYYEMTRDAATSTWGASGRFYMGAETWYRFMVDLVGDDQVPVADARHKYLDVSSIIVPATPFWYAHLDNTTQLRNNAAHRVVATAIDTDGNTGTNLNSEMPGSDEAQGPILFIHDRTAPVVNAIVALNDLGQPLPYTRISPQIEYYIGAAVSDAPFTDVNVMSVDVVRFEYTPNRGEVWLPIGVDESPINGWVRSWTPPDPSTDGYDNDGDGLWDEDDEKVSEVTIRAIAIDTGMNSGYSDRQNPIVTLVLTIDAAEPSAELTTPLDGEVFGYNESILLSGTAIGDWIPAMATNDVDRVRFQAKINRYFYLDDTYNGVGHDGAYDNGIDEIWLDVDDSGTFNAGDTVEYAGADGTADYVAGVDQATAMFWFDLDPTPQDNSDDPWLTSANNGDNWEMTWIPSGFSFIRADLLGGDEYTRLRMLSRDTAGNWDTLNDLYGPKETLIILNDDTAPRAFITHLVVQDDAHLVDPAETFAIQGLNPTMIYGSYFATQEAASVAVYAIVNAQEVFVGGDNDLDNNSFSIAWDASALPEGEYELFATIFDIDQNESDHATATRIRVRIDRTAPTVAYDVAVGSFPPFVNSAGYDDDSIVDHASLAIVPDENTADVDFIVTSTHADIAKMTLQWRWASDPVGLWRPAAELLTETVQPVGAFDYEPNLDFGDNHVWWLHVENFPDNLLQTGRMHFRALAVDEAGNSNALQTTWAEYTADNLDPVGFDWNDDSPTDQIEVGATVNFEISVQDALMNDNTRTDIEAVTLQYRPAQSTTWMTYVDPTASLNGMQIDTGNAMWIARFAWVAPSWVVHDTVYEFRVLALDTAGNVGEYQRSGYTITVEDNAPPDRSKVIDILAEVQVAADGADPDDKSDDACAFDAWADLNDDDHFTLGTDWLVDEGADFTPPENDVLAETIVGDPMATWPRRVGESYLNDAAVRNTVKVARTVTIVGRTQSDDDGIGGADYGIEVVKFLLQPVDASGNPVGNWYELGVDECRPNFPLYYWHWIWDTTNYPNGTYKLGVYAMDQEGNVEDTSTLDWTTAIIVIDNEAPTAQMDANAATETVEKTVTVERNRPFTLFARTLKPGTATVENYEDDIVEFMYKRARDLNMADSWGSVPNEAGATYPNIPEDGNPDLTRPYSFDVHMGRLTEPTDIYTPVPLAVGEEYDFAVAVTDEVGNQTSVIESFADDAVPGVGTRYIRLLIQDTIAPHLEFTQAIRKGGDETPIDNPTKIHAQGFYSITARLLTGDLDMSHAEFVYRLKGTQDWNLIDATLTSEDEGRTWVLGQWDLQTLQHNTWYEVACVGVDDVGNVDADPDIIEIYVDYEAPPFALVAPAAQKWCNGIMDLIVQVDRGSQQQHDDVFDVVWLWKKSTDPDVAAEIPGDPRSPGWKQLNVAAEVELYDDATNRYSNTLELGGFVVVGEGEQAEEVDVFASNLYDLRVLVIDDAGNANVIDVNKNTVDLDAPDYAQISNIKWEGDDTTQDPNDQGQTTDVTAGTTVEIFGTASDDELGLPNFPDPDNGTVYETYIAMMQFQVAYDLNQDGNVDDGTSWHDLGVWNFDPANLGDISAQTASVLWNTTGLPEGDYLLRVIAVDECGLATVSGAVNVSVVDWTPPIARIVAWDADQQPHGDVPPSLVTIYALAECDTTDANPETAAWDPTYDVQLQYNVREAGENSPVGPWVNIGIALPIDNGDRFTTEHLWMATIDPMLFGTGVEQVWLRALVKDESGNRYGDLPEDVVPTVAVEIVPQVDELGVADGTVTFEQIRSADMENGSMIVHHVKWMVESPTHLIVDLKMSTQQQTPRVILLSEPAEPVEYPSADDPLNYSPGVRRNGTLVGLTRSIDDPTVWRGEIFLEDPINCTHYALWVSGLDGIAGTAEWIDLDNVFMREFTVTTALGTNGTVKIPAYGFVPAGAKLMVPSGGWQQDPACLLVSPTYPPFMSTEQERYLNPVDQTAYHMEMLGAAGAFRRGYEPLVTFKYTDIDLAAALEGTESAEKDLTVRRWDSTIENRDGTTGGWSGAGISHIKVIEESNEVQFRVRDLSGGAAGEAGGATDLIFVLDGSGSIAGADWTLQLEGVAAALENPAIVPVDGSVAVAVVQFSSAAQTEVALTKITSAGVASTMATQVRALTQLGGGTAMELGIDQGVAAAGNGSAGARQVIVLSTDGAPNDAQLALAAADAAIQAGIEELHALGVGSGADMTFLNTLVRNGTATAVATFQDFATAVDALVSTIISGGSSGNGNVFQLFAPKRNAPVVVSNMWPNSPYVTEWRTDADPVLVAYLREPGGQVIDPFEAELLIDGLEWASWLDGDGDAEFIRGNGQATLTYANQDQTVMELVYHHSTYPRDWLTDGNHLLTVRYKAVGSIDKWESSTIPFFVDRKSPTIEFDGGFVHNPNLRNIRGYMNPASKLVAKMFDNGTGILFKHDRPWYYADLDCDGLLNLDERQFDPVPNPSPDWLPEGLENVNCWIRADWSVKYDVWRVDPSCPEPCAEDDQNDIDEIEERHLLHQGTANELEPWIMQNGVRITLDEYDINLPLEVPVAVLGGGSIKDGDVLEITWYSEKSIEQNSDGPGWGCGVDTVYVNGNAYLLWDSGCSYDAESQEMHIYEEGVIDWASNSGSKYVEQRFIVDMSAPSCIILSPAVTVEPNGDLMIDITFSDAGAGIDPATVSLTVIDPEGNLVAVENLQTTSGRVTGKVTGPLMQGEWQVKFTSADYLGNACNTVRTVKVESAVLAMTHAMVTPNPFSPGGSGSGGGLGSGYADISFYLSRGSEVTVKVYDFAGLHVATLKSLAPMASGLQHVHWAGQADDGTDLANGAYIIRIAASDGVRIEEQNLKVVIWRE